MFLQVFRHLLISQFAARSPGHLGVLQWGQEILKQYPKSKTTEGTRAEVHQWKALNLREAGPRASDAMALHLGTAQKGCIKTGLSLKIAETNEIGQVCANLSKFARPWPKSC